MVGTEVLWCVCLHPAAAAAFPQDWLGDEGMEGMEGRGGEVALVVRDGSGEGPSITFPDRGCRALLSRARGNLQPDVLEENLESWNCLLLSKKEKRMVKCSVTIKKKPHK